MPTTTLAATNDVAFAAVAFAGLYDLWLVSADCSFRVNAGTALDASNLWAVGLNKQPAGTNVATFTINTGALATWRNYGAVAIGALLGTTNFVWNVIAVKTGTPGPLFAMVRVNYRLVG